MPSFIGVVVFANSTRFTERPPYLNVPCAKLLTHSPDLVMFL